MAEMRVHVDNPTSDPVKVSGTITTSPSGTQNVSVTSPTTFATYGVSPPGLSGVYLFSMNDIPGVVATNNFLTLTNPVGSGKIIYMPYVAVSTYAYSGGAAVSNSMIVSMATAVSGGTVETTNVLKMDDTYPAAAGVVRTGAITATAGAPLIGVPPAFNSGSGVNASILATLEANAAAGTIKLTEGNSFLFRTVAGDVDQRWNFTIAWIEF